MFHKLQRNECFAGLRAHLSLSSQIKLDSSLDQGLVGLPNTTSWNVTRISPEAEEAHTWEYGTMSFYVPRGIDPLPIHEGSLRLLRSETNNSSGTAISGSGEVRIFDKGGETLSSCMRSAVFSPVNLEEYLSRGLGIVSRLPDVSRVATQFIPEDYARIIAHEAVKAVLDLGSIYCGEGIREVLSIVSGDASAADNCIESAIRTHLGRDISVRLLESCRRVAAEYDAMASVMGLDEASDYLFSRFMGNGRIISLTKLLLRTAGLIEEDSRNVHVVQRGLNASMRSFSFLWNGAITEARRLIDKAKEIIGHETQSPELQEIDFWDSVSQLSRIVSQPRISLDAVVAIALAELGVVLNCHPEGITILRAVAGDEAPMTKKPISITNPAMVWLSPFRALTIKRVVLALDGRTTLSMVDELAGVRHTLGLFRKCESDETRFLCCEPLPYLHVKIVKSTMPKAFAALASDGEPWNDGLQQELQDLSERKVPPDGMEVDVVVTAARECYLRNNVLAEEYARVVFSVKRIVRVFTLAVEQGRRMGDILYQYSLLMIHPDVSRIDGRRLKEIWDNVESLPVGMRKFVENVRLTHDGWMVYPESGSAGVRQVRRQVTHLTTVWLGLHREKIS